MMATALRRLTTQHAAAYVRAQPYAMRRSMVLVRAAADNKKPDNKITKGELVRRALWPRCLSAGLPLS